TFISYNLSPKSLISFIYQSTIFLFPFFVDLSRPEDVLNHTCNFYLNTEDGISVGVWHTLPASQWEKSARRSPEWYRETLGDGTPVIIYLHGNVGTRWDKSSRIEILELILMESSGYYRTAQAPGFGDSTGDPSEAGLTNDALYLYHWVKKHSRGNLICLWGHSLGSGVATNAAISLTHMFLLQHLCSLKSLISPLLILHAEDDNLVPYHMGLEVQKFNTDAHVDMISYSTSLGFSHSSIYLDPNLPDVVSLLKV
uniref:AB hydrolase-1 domain-containing protein n=1 Tax=Oreochromis aureus TaxID=47969 RepID=A0A668W050_OREAU